MLHINRRMAPVKTEIRIILQKIRNMNLKKKFRKTLHKKLN